jgi:hypothetical protein
MADVMKNHELGGGCATPLKNMTSSVGMRTFPTEWKVISNSMVPNPQPDGILW